MKINLMSDLHLEFAPLDLPGGEILFLVGDITVADALRKERTDSKGLQILEITHDFFDEASAKYQKVYYIAGNHEFYHGRFEETYPLLRQFASGFPNVTFLQNTVEELTPNTMLFGATSWTDLGRSNPAAIERARMCMNDFHCISKKSNVGYVRFKPEDSINEHEITKQKLLQALKDYPDKDFVVMTHHCPTYRSIHPKYGDDLLNFAFSSEDSEIILDNPRIKHFFHGHTHESFDYMVGSCRVVCNPRGYTSWVRYKQGDPPENEKFDINLTIEIPN